MSYEVIEKNKYGVLVREKSMSNCGKCKYSGENVFSCLQRCESDMYGYYLTDSEAAKLESENPLMNITINDLYVESKLLFDCQDELKSLQIENKKLKERIEELESEKSTELITKNEGSFYQETITKCCGIGMIAKENFCPNCGRKIIKK